MLNKDQSASIFSRIQKFSTADEVEAFVYGGRTARATTNKLDDESLKRVVQASESLAKVQHPDPDLLPMPDAAEAARSAHPLPPRHFEQTAAITPEARAEAVKKIVAAAEKHKLTTAGIFSTSESQEAIFNSRGLSHWHTQTSSEISITMLAPDSSGWQKANSPNVSLLYPALLGEIAAEKAAKSAAPREIPAGKYAVILEPPRCSTWPASCSGISAAWPFWTSGLS